MATDFVLFLLTVSISFITLGVFAVLHKRSPTEPQLKDAAVSLLSTEPAPAAQQSLPPPLPASVPAMMPSSMPQHPYGLYPSPFGGIPNYPMNPPGPLQPPVLVNGAYQILHQRYNKQLRIWELFNPVQSAHLLAEALFLVYFRHESPGAGGQVRKVVEIRSPSLRNVLKDCLRSVEFVENAYYEAPMQYLGPGQHQMHMNRPREPKVSFEQNPQIDAQKLSIADQELAKELGKLKDKVKILETSEVIQRMAGGTGAPETTTAGTTLAQSAQTTTGTTEPDITEARRRVDHLEKLLDFLETEFGSTKKSYAEFIANGQITYHMLWFLFRINKCMIFEDDQSGLAMAGQITGARYLVVGDVDAFEIIVQYIDYNGTTFHLTKKPLYIKQFNDVYSIRELGMDLLVHNSDIKKAFIRRGEAFVKLKGVHYMEYHDNLLKRDNSGNLLKFRAKGRAMVDCTSHQKMNPTNLVPVHEEDILDHVSSDQLHLCVPTVMGYSFSRKMWGRFIANKFTTVVWNKTAFDLLVLPRATKELVQSLVHADRSNVNVIKDVISGKGGGCILLLHGKPGTGKTLTAEAVAEEQEKPLLVISIAELGCNAARLEAGLTGILELARLWDAVILLDEADVFLEERGLHELERNAMVGVFLRLLEYHDGIMFLTTNRLEAIDEAFKSRISVAIKYHALDYTARRQIWINFLNLARVRIIPEMSQVDAGTSYLTTAEVDQLASKVLNGREIKNSTRTAQAISISSGRPLNITTFIQVLDIAEQFNDDFKVSDGPGWRRYKQTDMRRVETPQLDVPSDELQF